MAINKKLIHFKTFANFNSLKLSANEANTKYTTGISGTETSGNPDILYQSICFIKDTQQIWTHGLIYNASADGGGSTITEAELLDMGFTKNLGTITEVKMNGASKGTSGIVDLGTVITEHQDISGKADNTSVVHKTGNETITGAKTFNSGVNFLGSGDSNAITLSTNTRINVNGTNQTVLGFGNSNFYINHGNYNLLLRGKATRPTYNNADVALYSDVSGKQDKITDLDTIRDNANQVASKQDIISDLDDIRRGASKGDTSGVFVKFNELFAEGTITTNESDVFNVVKTAMESNTPLLLCDNNYSIILVSYYPLKVGGQIIASGILSQNVYNFTFTSGSNQITVTKLSVATLSNNLVSALGLESPLGKTYALPNTDAEAWADDYLLTSDAGVYKNKDYEGYDLGVVDGLYEERNGNPWALPSSDFSDVVGSEFTLASEGDVPAYYIADETANPLVLRSRDNDTNCYPGRLISIYFAEQFQEDQNQTISINGNEYDLLPTGLSANSGDTLLFVFSDDYIEPVLVARAKELSTARSINGMNFRGSTNIYNFAVCSTAASTANKIVSINNFTPNYGAQIRVLFYYSNTNAAPTLNVNNTGAKSMKYNGNAITNSNFTFDTNKIYTFTCKDSSWDLEGDWDKGGGSSNANVQAVDTGDVLDDVNVDYATTAYVDNKVANISLADYATTEYVDGLVGDINSVLESIING